MNNPSPNSLAIENADLTAIYSGNGNIIGVVLFKDNLPADYKINAHLRESLAEWGQEHDVDSIMLLTGNPNLLERQGYHFRMDVFEPLGSDDSGAVGSWSSMCGNGLMAASLFYEDNFEQLDEGGQVQVQTKSGLRASTKVGSGRYSVCMGEFTHNLNDLVKYVSSSATSGNSETLRNPVLIPEISDFAHNWSVGLSGNRDELNEIDGEPHLILINQDDNQPFSIVTLREEAVRLGQSVTKNTELFPNEINTNFVVVQGNDRNRRQMSTIACTHERGLGDDSDHCVTDACGTGATAIAATLYRLYNLDDNYMVNVQMPGGLLQVYRDDNQFYLTGSAKQLGNNL